MKHLVLGVLVIAGAPIPVIVASGVITGLYAFALVVAVVVGSRL